MNPKSMKPKKPKTQMFSVSQNDCAKTFTEWERGYREEPERFQSEAVKLLRETPKSYGQACAPYFLKIMSEIQGKRL